MNHLSGLPREQKLLLPEAIDDYVAAEAPVRFLDEFVNTLDLRKLGFDKAVATETGRPPYHPGDLLRLYLYGYLHRIRSSRLLEKELPVWVFGMLRHNGSEISPQLISTNWKSNLSHGLCA